MPKTIDLYEEGICPTCNQNAQAYPVKVDRSMAKALCLMFRKYGRTWTLTHDVHQDSRLNSKIAKMRFWGLVERNPLNAQLYRVTRTGVLFLTNHMAIQKYIYVYNDEIYAVTNIEDQANVTYRETLEEEFSLYEILEKSIPVLDNPQGQLFPDKVGRGVVQHDGLV